MREASDLDRPTTWVPVPDDIPSSRSRTVLRGRGRALCNMPRPTKPTERRPEKLELRRGARGPAPRPRLTPAERAVADFILRGERDGIGHVSKALGVSADHAAKIIAGTKAPPVGFDFEAVTQAVEPLCTPRVTSIDLASVDDVQRDYVLRDRFGPYIAPREQAGRPHVTVSVDRVVLVASPDDWSWSALYARFPTASDGRSREEKLVFLDGEKRILGTDHAFIRVERASKPQHAAKPHERYDCILRFKVFTGCGPWKQVARLAFAPRSNLAPVRFEVTGEGASRGLALALARTYLHPLVAAGSILIQSVEVAFDLSLRPERLIVLHDPLDVRARLGTATRSDKLGATIIHMGASGGVVLYDKLAEIVANRRFIPPHARGANHLTRIEVRLRRKKRGFDGSPAGATVSARSFLREIAVADLVNQEALGTTAWMLELTRRHGILARSTTLATMTRPKSGEQSPQRFGMQGMVYRALVEERGLDQTTAHERAVLIHAWTLERLRRLAASTSWSLTAMLDEAAPERIEPLLSALVTVPSERR